VFASPPLPTFSPFCTSLLHSPYPVHVHPPGVGHRRTDQEFTICRLVCLNPPIHSHPCTPSCPCTSFAFTCLCLRPMPCPCLHTSFSSAPVAVCALSLCVSPDGRLLVICILSVVSVNPPVPLIFDFRSLVFSRVVVNFRQVQVGHVGAVGRETRMYFALRDQSTMGILEFIFASTKEMVAVCKVVIHTQSPRQEGEDRQGTRKDNRVRSVRRLRHKTQKT